MIMIEDRLTVKERCEIMSHIERKAKMFGKTAATDDIYTDIFNMAMRESGTYGIDYVNPKYLYAVHEAIDSYELPSYLMDKMEEGKTNDGENNSADGNSELG